MHGFDKNSNNLATIQEQRELCRLINKVVKRTLDISEFDTEYIQGVLKDPNVSEARITAMVVKLILGAHPDADERLEYVSDIEGYGYLGGYRPQPIADQLTVLSQYFPELNITSSTIGGPLPVGAEGLFAIPDWQIVAPTYCGALQKVLNMHKENLKKSSPSNRYWETGLESEILWFATDGGYDCYRQTERSLNFWDKIRVAQNNNNVLIIAAQLGRKYMCRSAEWVMENYAVNEFGLGAYEIAVILLTHPNRLGHFDDLGIECPGDECNAAYTYSGVDWGGVNISYQGRINDMDFKTYEINNCGTFHSGSATAFV